MSTTFYVLHGESEDALYLAEGTGTVNEVPFTLHHSEVNNYSTLTPVGVPGTDGQSGDFEVIIHITTGHTDGELQVRLARTDSNGNVIEETDYVNVEATTAGTKTFTFTNVDLGTWQEGNRLRINIDSVRVTGKGGAEYYVQTGETSGVEAPWVEEEEIIEDKSDTDALSLAVAETAQVEVTVSASDTLSVSVQETEDVYVVVDDQNISVDDLATITAVDTSNLYVEIISADNLTLDIAESDADLYIIQPISDTDILSVGLEEVALTTSTQPLLDSTALSLQEQASIQATLNDTDSLLLQVSEDIGLSKEIPKSDTDNITLNSVETATVNATIAGTDSPVLSLIETGIPQVTSSVTDTIMVYTVEDADKQIKELIIGYIIRRRIGTEGEWETIAEVEAKMDEPRVPILSGRMMTDYVELTTD